jgi:hypothetical protein
VSREVEFQISRVSPETENRVLFPNPVYKTPMVSSQRLKITLTKDNKTSVFLNARAIVVDKIKNVGRCGRGNIGGDARPDTPPC